MNRCLACGVERDLEVLMCLGEVGRLYSLMLIIFNYICILQLLTIWIAVAKLKKLKSTIL
jgi:hypothetical protein